RNNSPIAGATSASYQIAAVQLSDAGDYKVTVSNAAGTTTSTTATVTVGLAPLISAQPSGKYAYASTSFNLSVQATGTDRPLIKLPLPRFQTPEITLPS